MRMLISNMSIICPTAGVDVTSKADMFGSAFTKYLNSWVIMKVIVQYFILRIDTSHLSLLDCLNTFTESRKVHLHYIRPLLISTVKLYVVA